MDRAHFALIIAASISLLSGVRADDAKPSLLSPKEIEEGWILLFDGETTFGWTIEGEVKVDEGQLRLGGTKKSAITTTSAFGPCEIRLDYYRTGDAYFSVNSESKQMRLKSAAGKEFESHFWWSGLKIITDSYGLTAAEWSHGLVGVGIKIGRGQAKGGGAELDAPSAPLRLEVDAGSKLCLKNIKLKPKGAKPLFNGKDLSGWKMFEDAKRNQSKWTVTKEGWLNVKNGPGDLQSEGQFADFLLQFECISNGKALNSGVFFRCIANEYQNGYEAQVQNGYKDDDRTKPADFGTGAIYRRIPARKVVSNDNEWFTMTLLAQGNHIATWVNGYQTVDWIDDRPADANPRKGSKTGAGHLSIQGHDPTTDLSFRNLRIVELKAADKK